MPTSANVTPQLSPAESGRTITATSLDTSKVTVSPASQVTNGAGTTPSPFVISAVAGAPTSGLANLVQFVAVGSPNISRNYQVALNASGGGSGYPTANLKGLWQPQNSVLQLDDLSTSNNDETFIKPSGYGLDPVYHAAGGGTGPLMEYTACFGIAVAGAFAVGAEGVIFRTKASGSGLQILGYSQVANPGTYMNLFEADGSGHLKCTFYDLGAGAQISVVGGTVLAANTTYHGLVVHDGSTIKLYLNNVLDGTATPVGALYAPASKFVASGYAESGIPPNGAGSALVWIGDHFIYDAAPDAAKRLTIYNAGKSSYPDLP